jgi:ClpX C4-type zinc finger
MVLDRNLLEQARLAGTRLASAEREALLARADYNTAIRRLHLGGASLREVAQALAISHQRVQQVVSAAGGSWWQAWRRRGEARDAVCSWCHRSPREVDKLIAGPKVYICDACVAASERALRARDVAPGRNHRCDFCRKRPSDDRAIVAGPPNVCSECLRVCREILDASRQA